MSLPVRCPACQTVFDLADAQAGQAVSCAVCHHDFVAEGTTLMDNLAYALLHEGDDLDWPAPPDLTAEEMDAENRFFDRRRPRRFAALALRLLAFVILGATVALVAAAPRLAPVAVPPSGFAVPPNDIPDAWPAPPENPYVLPGNVDEAIAALRDPHWGRRIAAADYLMEAPVDEARRAEAAQALEAMLADFNRSLHEPAAAALVRWHRPETRDFLYGLAQRETASGWAVALRTLVRLGDERAPSIAAAYLPHFFKRGEAARALELAGPAAEKEILPYLDYSDPDTRRAAVRLLRVVGSEVGVKPLEAAARKDPLLAGEVRDALAAIGQRK